MSEPEHAHQLIDLLPEPHLTALVGLLETIVDPVATALRNAPIDDEPLTPEESAAMQTGVDSLERNGGVPMETVLSDLGLTMDDFRRMGRSDSPESR